MVTNFNSYNLILIMNKILKCLLVGIFSCLLLPCFTHADTVSSLINPTTSSFSASTTYNTMIDFGAGVGQKIVCIGLTWNGGGDNLSVGFTEGPNDTVNNYTFWRDWNGKYNCLTKGSNTRYLRGRLYSSSATVTVNYFFLDDLLNANLPESEMSSIDCQTEYNLIPISDVTANYCKLNFNLISPSECPESGTGAVNWNAWYINNEQYPGTASLQIWIPEFIKYTVTYNTEESEIEIEGYNADEDYIEGVIDNEKLTPTKEDFALLLQGVVNFIPYLFIGLLIFFTVKIINKIWR